MRRGIIIFNLLVTAVVSSIFILGKTENESLAAESNIQISEDTIHGRITVETPDIKGVWHYKALPSENYCQGGGNLFQLYYKPTDPEMTSNLVNYAQDHGLMNWGNERATGRWMGIGGIGSTDMYSADLPPADSGTYRYADLFSDNNAGGELEYHNVSYDENGNAILTFSFKVKNSSNGTEWYRVVKTWTIEPDSKIHLDVDWTILRSGYFSEPTVHNIWDGDMKWDRWVKYGSDWYSNEQNSQKYILSSGSLPERYFPVSGDTTFHCFSYLNAFNADWIAYVDSPYAPNIVVHNYMGASVGRYNQTVLEQTIGQLMPNSTGILGGYGANWMTWWGGNPPTGDRYQWLDQGTEWSHSFMIELTEALPQEGPDIESVKSTRASSESARISWSTDIASDSVVEILNSGGGWEVAGYDPTLTQQHSVVIADPVSSTYKYRVKSIDSNGNISVGARYEVDPNGVVPVNIALSESDTFWASYQDFQRQILSVDIEARNHGPVNVQAMTIESAEAGSGVTVDTGVPVELGGIASGSSTVYRVTYNIPAGIYWFKTHFSGTAIDEDGNSHSFPIGDDDGDLAYSLT